MEWNGSDSRDLTGMERQPDSAGSTFPEEVHYTIQKDYWIV